MAPFLRLRALIFALEMKLRSPRDIVPLKRTAASAFIKSDVRRKRIICVHYYDARKCDDGI